MFLTIYLIIILFWSLVFFHQKIDRSLEHVGLGHVDQSTYFTREHFVIRMLNLPSDILNSRFLDHKTVNCKYLLTQFWREYKCKCPGDVHLKLKNFYHLNTLWITWPRVLFAMISMSSWQWRQSLTWPAWGMMVNVNFSNYFFSHYSNKDEQINGTAYFYKIWCYKQHKLLHLSLYIWQG